MDHNVSKVKINNNSRTHCKEEVDQRLLINHQRRIFWQKITIKKVAKTITHTCLTLINRIV